MESGHIIGLVAVVCMFGLPMIIGVVEVAMKQWSCVQKHRDDVDLKHKLVDAGFSVEEIERVMNPGRNKIDKPDKKTGSKQVPPGAADNELHLKVG